MSFIESIIYVYCITEDDKVSNKVEVGRKTKCSTGYR